MADRLPRGTVLRIHYEALCAKPAEVLAQIFRFIGVDPDQGTLDFRSREHHVLGNIMRLSSTSAISLSERWRTALMPDDLRVFDAVAGKLNRKYGYE